MEMTSIFVSTTFTLCRWSHSELCWWQIKVQNWVISNLSA